MNFIQIFQTQSFRNFVENIIEAEYNMKIYHADMNLTFQYIYTKVIHSSQEIDTCFISIFLVTVFNKTEQRETQKHPTHFTLHHTEEISPYVRKCQF